MSRASILAEVLAERQRQDRVHPSSSDLPDGTGGSGRAAYRTLAQETCNWAARKGQATFAHVLEEEVAEALAETDPAKLRTELVQCSAVCVRWIEAIDRRLAR